MRMLDHLTSLMTLVSLIVLGPPLGRTILRDPKSPLVQAIGTMIAVTILLAVYGMIWSIRPTSVRWYTWLSYVPVSGDIGVTGSIATDVSEPLRVQIDR